MNSPLARIVSAFAGLWLMFWIFSRGPGPHGPLRCIGLILALLGLGGVIVARWTLGKSFSVTPQARHLVTHGIYSKVRNPIYLSSAVLMAGVLLMIELRYLWILMGVLIIVQAIRARREARVLEEKFGNDYRAYRKRTWF